MLTHAPGVSPLGRLRSVSWLLLAFERGEASPDIRLPLLPTHVAVYSTPELKPSRLLQFIVVRAFGCRKQGERTIIGDKVVEVALLCTFMIVK